MIFSSKLIEDAVNAFAQLPGIGKKTALRMVLHLLKEHPATTQTLSDAIARMRAEVCFCPKCHNISDEQLCGICQDETRDQGIICIVENIRDVIAIESTRQFNGLYHVIGGLLSPLDGVGPDQLHLGNLTTRLQQGAVKELIMALSPTIEGDTTVYYISKLVQDLPINISGIARGISFGTELEYTDELTLARSIAKRVPLNASQV